MQGVQAFTAQIFILSVSGHGKAWNVAVEDFFPRWMRLGKI